MQTELRTVLDEAFTKFSGDVAKLVERWSTVPPPPAPASKVGRKAKRIRRTRGLLVEQALALAILIGKHPEGVKSAQLVKESGIAKERIGVPLSQATKKGLVRRTGNKGGSMYFPA